MSEFRRTARRQVEVTNALGIHLRPAERFVERAQSFRSDIRVECDGRRANGKSILDLATPAAVCGAMVDIEATGPDAEEAVAALTDLVSGRFREDDAAGLQLM